jgi:hypothetical protein
MVEHLHQTYHTFVVILEQEELEKGEERIFGEVITESFPNVI